MRDLTNPTFIKLKGFLFLLIGLLAAALLILEQLALKTAILLAICVWCFCRFYYFAFYVIEHYVDPGFRFSGLWSFAGYLLERRRKQQRPPAAAGGRIETIGNERPRPGADGPA